MHGALHSDIKNSRSLPWGGYNFNIWQNGRQQMEERKREVRSTGEVYVQMQVNITFGYLEQAHTAGRERPF